MELILKEDIIGLGYKNDIVKVKNGYGRNYLIPTGKAIVATPSARKVLAENLKQQATKLAKAKSEAEKKGVALEGVSLTIAVRVAASGVTYGSVNVATVAQELQAKGFDIDRKIITMKDIKAVGRYEAVIHFHKEVEVRVPVIVVAEEETKATVPETEEIPQEETPKVEDAPEEEEEFAEEQSEEEAE